jgi:hypothetical protein
LVKPPAMAPARASLVSFTPGSVKGSDAMPSTVRGAAVGGRVRPRDWGAGVPRVSPPIARRAEPWGHSSAARRIHRREATCGKRVL